MALLSGDGNALAETMGADPEIYDCYNGIVILDWGVRIREFDYYGQKRDFTLLDITVTSSNSVYLPVGKDSIVLEAGVTNLTFTRFDYFATFAIDYSSAERYVKSLFYKSEQFGICDFIVARLNIVSGNDDPRNSIARQ